MGLIRRRLPSFQVGFGGRVCAGLVAILFLSSCGTIKLGGEDAEAPALVEGQMALRAAANALEETPWRKPDDVSVMGRLASVLLNGGEGEEGEEPRLTRSASADEYVARRIVEAGSPDAAVGLVFEDARITLGYADALLAAAEDIAAARPQRDLLNQDIAILEQAIVELRNHRDMYERIFAALDSAGEASLSRLAVDSTLGDFNQSALDIGAAADTLVDLARAERRKQERGIRNWLLGPLS